MNPQPVPVTCTPMHQLPDAALEQVAAYFRALGEPRRLEILQWLDQRPYNVSELAQRCACSIANISRHLALLTRQGMVQREVRGRGTYYRLADASLNLLYHAVHAHLARQDAGAFWAGHTRER